MRTPEQVRNRLEVMWRRQWTTWLGGGGDWPNDIPLDVPTEREAQRKWPEFMNWLAIWRSKPLGGELLDATRTWPTMGRQDVPTHVRFANAREIAMAVGHSTAELFTRADERWQDRAAAWPDLANTLRGHAEWMSGLSDKDYRRFITVVDWLTINRNCSLYLRQLPIAGLDTKWIEQHMGPIAKLLAIRFGVPTGSLQAIAGLKTEPARRRIKLLDPVLRAKFGGLSDVTVRLDELRALEIPAQLALVVENQETALACEDLSGAVALMGGGFAVTELGTVPWLARIPIIYWGDIDTAGFAILSMLRHYHPHTVSCLMDEETLLKHRPLWSSEKVQTTRPNDGLDPSEAKLYQDLMDGEKWGTGVRLEQERLSWREAWSIVNSLAESLRADTSKVE
jgi:hypothetical protein